MTFIWITVDTVSTIFDILNHNIFKLQADNGVPVYLKGGTTDYALYGITLILNAIGLGMCVHLLYLCAFDIKEE